MFNPNKVQATQFKTSLVQIKLTGDDVSSFLQNQSTYNISELNESSFHLVSFLDPHGKIIFYGYLGKLKTHYELYVPASLETVAIDRLNLFLISEDVEIDNLGLKVIYFALGPLVQGEGLTGIVFEEKAILSEKVFSYDFLSEEEINFWRDLNGWPSMDARDFEPTLLNNSRLYDLSLSSKKGCYPGQETVAKIATRRGAAYSPVLIKLDKEVNPGVVSNFEKKIGKINSCYFFQGSFYANADLLRDFRVNGLKIEFKLENQSFSGVIQYFPFFKADPRTKAEELLYEAIDLFKKNNNSEAEKTFRHAIEVDPSFSDAFESLGVMLGREERFQEAIDLMDKLLEVDPSSVMAHTNKSLYLMRLGKIEEAENEKSLATVKSFQKFGEEAKLKEQIEAENKKAQEELNKREEMFLQVLDIDAEDTLANYGLGTIAIDRQNYSKAIDHLQKVIEADPTYSVAYLALGKAYKGAGKVSEAKSIWTKGVEVAAKKGDLMPANQMQTELNGF